jgi:hypothetical protein
MTRTRLVVAALLATLAVVPPATALAQATRLVVVKADGLPQDVIDELVREKNPRTGQSALPWIERVFYQGGTRLANFYVRGLSLSGPSWSMLDTGHHLHIKGNVEYDRYTQHGYDYLNFLPFWLGTSMGDVIDMWGSSVMDDLGIPLLYDAYGHDEHYQSFQLFQRGARWTTLSTGAVKRFTTRTPKQLVDEWFVGYDTRGLMTEQFEREIIAGLADTRVRYLDYYTTDYDHAAHHNRDKASHRFALQDLDATIGRLWTAISRSPQAAETAFVLVSDHGSNSDERVYSQGFNLVHLLGGAAGGGHHVVTKRRLMVDYSIKGIYPFVPLITTASNESRYLKGQGDDYPTALLDFDGNERAAFHLRDSTLNELHILLAQLQRRDLAPAVRGAAVDAFLAIVDRHRAGWRQMALELRNEISALRRAADALRPTIPLPPDPRDIKRKKAVPESYEARDERLRLGARLATLTREANEYDAYVTTVERLLTATRDQLSNPKAIQVEAFMAKHAMGERNTLSELQHYVVGPGAAGLVLASDGSLDLERSFARVDYVGLLNSVRVRNNVQPGVSNAPIDYTVIRVPCGAIRGVDVEDAESCIWLSAAADAQGLVLARTDPVQGLLLRYAPIARLTSPEEGVIHATPLSWRNGLPLRLWEDERLELPAGVERLAWLDAWHPELDWFRATHRTMHSNAVIGIHEQFVPHELPLQHDEQGVVLGDEQLIRRLRLRQRALVEPDIAVIASNHWNFDVRGFNPGGNHGSFLRVSTHAVLMFAGGDRTGIPHGVVVEEPHDSLSFMPTVLALTGQADLSGQPTPALRDKGFTTLPGRVIKEVLGLPAAVVAPSSSAESPPVRRGVAASGQ